ncbi:MAG: tRNA (N6-isopentenyl adenosine(37)-C2)-methylthiotransferase MiaB [Rickettsiales bacterium]|jgi:tRNA-2-methylthio-N6-dimethylallyladenosine synthase|nr:tRNA (N6-isopentenyl adenosine(37)-C2)-methylthiotransferase MiaB [Rickettsiales bacterium]
MKTFFIQTFGCQMNVYDGQRIAAMLCARGLAQTDSIPDADIIILNTCSVREKASNKVFSALGRIRNQKKPGALFGIVGCVAREAGADAFKRIPELNFVLGPQTYHKLPEILENPDARLLNIDLSGLEKFDELGIAGGVAVYDSGQSKTTFVEDRPTPLSYIPIQEGCDHCCTYCIVPFTRGRELSRPFSEVMRDVNAAAENGAVEICFLGQNVNGYKYSLADLIRETAKIESIKRIRFTSSYPTEMSDDLIALFGQEPKLLPFLNMPIQSGSPDVLTRMNRPYSLDLYIDITKKLRAARPDIQISSDFIVGFPGESEDDFEMTCDIARRIGYINSYSFKYSPRPHTAAALMPDQIPDNVKRDRLKILDDILTENNRRFNESCVNKTFECLIEGPDKTGKNMIARTPFMQQVIIKSEERRTKDDRVAVQPLSLVLSPSSLVLVKIIEANKCSLRGEIVKTKP